jgi:Mg-chelatase subunit ChlD
VDGALAALYGGETGGRRGGLGASAPQLARWLGDIRTYFPSGVVRLLQRDAIDRLGLDRLLLEPETLAAVEPDVHLVGTLLSLAHALPETTRESARAVVRRVADDLERRLAARTRALVGGALDRSARTRRPRPQDIDWQRTIRANLAHYLPEQRTVVPRRLVGGARTRNGCATQVILCVDQSASMASSVVHSAVFAAVLASVRGLTTRLVAFDTSVVDLTGRLADPVDVLFGVRLGGGTDIGRALAYCQSRVSRPDETVLALISDLAEGGSREELLRRVAALTASGVRVLALLALSDEGAPAYDHENAAAFAALGVDAFACTPDHFPEVMAAALERRPLPLPSAGQE